MAIKLDENLLLKYWDELFTMQEIADEFGCSTSVVRRLLVKNNKDCSRSAMMARHYAKEHAVLWPDIKKLLDAGESVNSVSKKVNVSAESLKMLIDRYDYTYSYTHVVADLHSDEYKQKLSDLLSNHTVKEMSVLLDIPERTLSRHLKNFGLTKITDRVDISDKDILNEWNNGLSIADIARLHHCSHDTVTKRLSKYNIEWSRATGIERHFQSLHCSDWDDIKIDLDNCVPISEVAVRHNIRYESVFRLIEQNKYKYNGFDDLDVSEIDRQITKSNDADKITYLTAIKNYYIDYGNRPVAYTLSRYMSVDYKIVQQKISLYNLGKYLGSNGLSTKVVKIMRDLDALNIKYELNNRTVLKTDTGFLEMDIYLPDYKLGIEVNPTWTHSPDTMPFGIKDRLYHQNKSIVAEDVGVGLIHMFDTDFIDADKYQVFLRQIEAITREKTKIGARQCAIKNITRDESNRFLKMYHFQGGESASDIQYGMYYNDALVGVFTVGESRYSNHDYEIIRYCMNPSYIVMGCFDKFLKNFLKNKRACTIVSYLDLNKRLSASNVYEKHGFVYDHLTVPNYVWINQSGTKYKTRYAAMKKKLVAQGFDSNKSEIEIMKSMNFCRVFEAGSKRYIYEYKGE